MPACTGRNRKIMTRIRRQYNKQCRVKAPYRTFTDKIVHQLAIIHHYQYQHLISQYDLQVIHSQYLASKYIAQLIELSNNHSIKRSFHSQIFSDTIVLYTLTSHTADYYHHGSTIPGSTCSGSWQQNNSWLTLLGLRNWSIISIYNQRGRDQIERTRLL